MNIAFLPNLAGPDGILILLIVLLLFGAKKLPELAKGMGQAVREFSKAKNEVENEIMRPPVAQPAPRIEPQKVASGVEIPSAGADLHASPQSDPHPAENNYHTDETTHQV